MAKGKKAAKNDKLEELELELKKDYLKRAYDAWFYSVQRQDLLIITISGAGIYLIMETLKFDLGSEKVSFSNLWLLKSAGIAFLLSIASNIVSQMTSISSNVNEIVYTKKNLLNPIPDAITKNIISTAECKSNLYDKWTKYLNSSSIVLMVLGIVLVACFMFLLF